MRPIHPITLALLLLPASPALPDASIPPASGDSRPAVRYAPSEPIPPGFVPVQLAKCDDGKPGYIETHSSRPHCEPLPADFVGEWRRESSMTARAAAVKVGFQSREPAGKRPSLREWARAHWPWMHGTAKDFERTLRDGQLRIWTTDSGEFVAQFGVAFSCRECDPIWRMRRVQERDGGVIFVDLAVYGMPRPDERDELRRAFLDGPLGPSR